MVPTADLATSTMMCQKQAESQLTVCTAVQVPEAHITQVVPTADLANSAVSLEVRTSAAAGQHHAVAVIHSEGACPELGGPCARLHA